MSYKVDYPAPGRNSDGGQVRRFQRIGAGLLAGLLTALLLWPRGRDALRNVIIPGDPAVTVWALEEMTRQLRAGDSLADSLEAFCRRVWEGGKLGPS